jgi:hypothetical protein
LIARSAWPTSVERLLLRDDDAGVLLGAVDQRHDRVDRLLQRRRRRRLQAAHVGGEHLGALLHLGERRRAADDRLRHRLGEALRLHHRLAGGADLGRAAARGEERIQRQADQADQAEHEQAEQDPLLLATGAADQRQVPASGAAPVSAPAAASR